MQYGCGATPRGVCVPTNVMDELVTKRLNVFASATESQQEIQTKHNVFNTVTVICAVQQMDCAKSTGGGFGDIQLKFKGPGQNLKF